MSRVTTGADQPASGRLPRTHRMPGMFRKRD